MIKLGLTSKRKREYDGLVGVDGIGGASGEGLWGDLVGGGGVDEVVVSGSKTSELIGEEKVTIGCISTVGADNVSWKGYAF